MLRARRNASFRLSQKRRSDYRTRRDLGEITAEEWKRLDDEERLRHRDLVMFVEYEWDRWPRSIGWTVAAVVGGAISYGIIRFIIWLTE